MAVKSSLMFEIIGSNKNNPWFVMDTIAANDIWDAETKAINKYGLDGYRTVQQAPRRR